MSKGQSGNTSHLTPNVAMSAALFIALERRVGAPRLQSLVAVHGRRVQSPQSAWGLPVVREGGCPHVSIDGVFFPEGSRGMERTVVMDKSKGEPVISVKTTSRSKERVSIAPALSSPAGSSDGLMTTLICVTRRTLFHP